MKISVSAGFSGKLDLSMISSFWDSVRIPGYPF